MLDIIIDSYNWLASKGINAIAMVIILISVHGIKTILNSFTFYNEKTGSIINLGIGLVISIGLSFVFYHYQAVNLIIINSITGASLSVYSREIIDAGIKLFNKKTNGSTQG